MNTKKLILFLLFCLTTMICQAQIQDAIRINEYDLNITDALKIFSK